MDRWGSVDFFREGRIMQIATTRWVLALTLALILAAPGLSRGEVTQRAGMAREGQGAASPIQVIRRVKVSEAYPAQEEIRTGRPPQKAANNQPKATSDADRANKNSLVKPSAIPVRSIPVGSIPIHTPVVRTSAVPTTTTRATPIRSVPIRLNTGRG